jgi:UDP:flavonoid glycosyltransferase YjiC (YdhE family)/DNA-binding NarL/FixJ family response regulator
VTRQLSNDASFVRVLLTFDLDEYVYEALSAGASGFVLKDDPPEQLIAATRTVAAGDALLSPTITKRVIKQFARISRPARPKEFDELTTREQEVFRLIAAGHSNAEIGQELYISDTTVKTHDTHILQKLNLRTASRQSFSHTRRGFSRQTRGDQAVAMSARLADCLAHAAFAVRLRRPMNQDRGMLRKMLFTFAGGTGHFLPLVPLARAAERAGHLVAFGGQPGMLSVIEQAGFSRFDTGGHTLLATSERTPLLELDMEREIRAVREGFAGRTARERAGAVLQLCEAWRPDVLVCDEMDFGALVAAECAGVPYATVVCIGSGSFVWRELVTEPLNELRAAHGLPRDPELAMLHRYLVLAPFPPSFRDPANPLPPTGHTIRPVLADVRAGDGEPAWLEELTARPLVYFTLGTIFNLESGDLFERVLAGLSGLAGSVIVTVGRELDPRALGPQPANVRVERYVPQSVLLPHCELVVSHGGSGSVVGALAHGLPMVLLPIGADQPLNAARCQELDVARVLNPLQVTAADVSEAASNVLSDQRYQRNAQRLKREIDASPGPERALYLLERLAAEKQAITAEPDRLK